MNQFNNSSEKKMKQVLDQHEFDFDTSAWEAMNDKLDQTGGSGAQNTSDDKNDRRNPYFWFILLLALIGIGGLLTYYTNADQAPLSETTTTIQSKPTNLQSNNQNTSTKNSTFNNDSHSENSNNAISESEKNTLNVENGQEVIDNDNFNNIEKQGSNSAEHKPFNSTSIAEKEKLQSNNRKGGIIGKKIDSSLGTNSGITSNQKPVNSARKSETTSSSNNYPKELPFNTSQKSGSILSKQSTIIDEQRSAGSDEALSSIFEIANSEDQFIQTKESSTVTFDAFPLLSSYSDQVVQKSKKSFEPSPVFKDVEKVKLDQPFPWHFNIKSGVNFQSTRNGSVFIDKNISASQFGQKSYLIETNIGYRLRNNLTVETGISYMPLSYLMQYSYYPDPANQNQWNIESIPQKVNQFSLPLRLQVNIFQEFRANIGGGISFRKLNGNFSSGYTPPANGEEIFALAKENYNPLMAFWEMGVGYDRGPWMLDFKYQRYINRFQKGFNYAGEKIEGNGQEWNFALTFGYRFQKYKEPLTQAISSIEPKAKKYGDVGFNFGIGLATGFDGYRTIGSLTESNLEINDFNSPLKFGVWTNFAPHPRFSVQLETWFQSQSINYSIDANSSQVSFLEHGSFNVKRLELPLDVQYKLSQDFKLIAGIGFALNFVKKNADLVNSTYPEHAQTFNDVPNYYKRNNFFWELGFGYDWDRFSLDLKYRTIPGSNDFLTPISDNGSTFEFFSQNNQFIFGLNYALQRK